MEGVLYFWRQVAGLIFATKLPQSYLFWHKEVLRFQIPSETPIHNSFHGMRHTADEANWSIAVLLFGDLSFLQNGDLWKHSLFPAVVEDLEELAHCCTVNMDKHLIGCTIWSGRSPSFQFLESCL